MKPRLWVLVAMLAFAATETRGDGMIHMRAGFMRLTLQPCTQAAVVAAITVRKESPLDYRQGAGMLSGKPFYACWKPAPGGAFMVDEDGDATSIPLDAIDVAPEA